MNKCYAAAAFCLIPLSDNVFNLGKDQPHVDHLDVGRLRQAAGDADEEGGEDQQGGQVHRHDRLEEEVLEEVGCVDDDEDKDSGKVDGEDGIQKPSLEDDCHLDSQIHVVRVLVGQGPVGDQVLGELRLRLHGDDVRGDLHH